MDYRELLIKYMTLIIREEDTAYLNTASIHIPGSAGKGDLTWPEMAELQRIHWEVKDGKVHDTGEGG